MQLVHDPSDSNSPYAACEYHVLGLRAIEFHPAVPGLTIEPIEGGDCAVCPKPPRLR